MQFSNSIEDNLTIMINCNDCVIYFPEICKSTLNITVFFNAPSIAHAHIRVQA